MDPVWHRGIEQHWQPCEYVVTTRCTESAVETILLRIYQVQLTLLCIVFQRIHNYKWQTFTIGNLILQESHQITKIVGGIEMKSAIPFQFRSIPFCNSNSNSNSTAYNSNSNSGIEPNPVLELFGEKWPRDIGGALYQQRHPGPVLVSANY